MDFTSEYDVYNRQILTSKVDPRTARVNMSIFRQWKLKLRRQLQFQCSKLIFHINTDKCEGFRWIPKLTWFTAGGGFQAKNYRSAMFDNYADKSYLAGATYHTLHQT